MADNTVRDHLGNEYPSEAKMCEHYGIERTMFRNRIKRGNFTLEEALTVPKITNRESWTDEEIKVLKEKYPICGTDIPELNRSASSIMHMAKRLNTLYSQQWSEEEIDILKKKYPVQGTNIPELNRSGQSIHTKASKLGLKIDSGKKWTEDEIRLLKKFYPTKGTKIPEINKTANQIRNKAAKMGILYSSRNWTAEEIELLKKYYPTCGSKIPGLNRPVQSIQMKAASFGISKSSQIQDIMCQWVNNKSGLKIRLIKNMENKKSGKTKYVFEFEDGTTVEKSQRIPEIITHPLLNPRAHNSKGCFAGFTTRYITTETGDKNWTAYYECECQKCRLRAIMTPQQMKEHYKTCKTED